LFPYSSNQVDMYTCGVRRRTHFLGSCLQDYHLMLRAADAEMEKAIEQMPLNKWKYVYLFMYIIVLLLKRCKIN
jgi:hypothetical protein